MNSKTLIQKGYFAKELPPPFETESFADKSRVIRIQWKTLLNNKQTPLSSEGNKAAQKRFKENYTYKYGSSKMTIFSLAKGLYSRRKLAIPNPKQYMDLSDCLIDHWKLLRSNYKISNYSQSTPVERNAHRALKTKSKSLNEFKFLLAEKCVNKKFELRLDISQFYPSIYTHSIPWGIMSKKEAKKYFKIKNKPTNQFQNLINSGDKGALDYRSAEFIDTLVRNCNERQSVGLPIGPDSSFLLAEVVANRIDEEIESSLSKIDHDGIRFFDDYYFYVNTQDEAEIVLKKVQQVLNEYQLETNENKVTITRVPFDSLEEVWAPLLAKYEFHDVDKYELRGYFSILFKLLKEHKNKTNWIVNYALMRFEFGHVRIKKESWSNFLDLLMQTMLADPSNIHQIFKIIYTYKSFLTKRNKETLNPLLENIINEHIDLRHSFEVSWALWIQRSFKLNVVQLS